MIYKNLTPEQKAAYLAASSRCPYCQSSDVEGDRHDYAGDEVAQNIHCNDCGREWVDVYRLAEVDDGEQCCDDCGSIIRDGADVLAVDGGGFRHRKCPTKPAAVEAVT